MWQYYSVASITQFSHHLARVYNALWRCIPLYTPTARRQRHEIVSRREQYFDVNAAVFRFCRASLCKARGNATAVPYTPVRPSVCHTLKRVLSVKNTDICIALRIVRNSPLKRSGVDDTAFTLQTHHNCAMTSLSVIPWVQGSPRDRFTSMLRPWTTLLHAHASVAKQYNLILAVGFLTSHAPADRTAECLHRD